MRNIILISFAFLCGASAQGVNDHLRVFFEQERENFPCGWPNYPWNIPQGLPPLEPFRTPRDWNMHFATLGSIYAMDSVITNQVIRGLQQFVLEHVQLEIIGMWMRLYFTIPVVNVDGQHETSGNLFQDGSFQPFSGRGNYLAQVRTFEIDSMSALSFLQPGNFLNVRAMNSQVRLGSLVLHMEGFGALTTTINSIVNGALPAYISHPDTQARLDQVISEVMMPVLNAQFNLITMPELISFLSGRMTNPPASRCPAIKF